MSMQNFRVPVSFLTASAALLLGSTALAQPANDECAFAQTVGFGTTASDNTGGSLGLGDPAWSCGANITSDVWFSFTATGSCSVQVSTCNSTGTLTDTVLEIFDGGCGALSLIVCNDDGCGTGFLSNATFIATAGSTYHIRIGGWGTGEGTFDLEIGAGPLSMVGQVNGGASTSSGASFTQNDNLTWQYVDCSSGNLAVTVWNLAAGGPPAVGATAEIPGFDQLWTGSTPPGLYLLGPVSTVPGPGDTFTCPPGLFNAGDTIRVQALMLDPINAPGVYPVVPSSNTLLFSYSPGSCAAGTFEGFEGVAAGVGNYPAGWSDGGGTQQWQVISSGTPSGGTGPQAAFEGTQYFYCETSSPSVAGDTYIMNSASYTNANAIAVQFACSRVGATIGQLDVSLSDGLTSTLLGSLNGPATTEWENVVLSLPSPLPASYNIVFTYTRGSSFTGDIAVDAVCNLIP